MCTQDILFFQINTTHHSNKPLTNYIHNIPQSWNMLKQKGNKNPHTAKRLLKG